MAVLFTINYRRHFAPRLSLDDAIGGEFLECVGFRREALAADKESESPWPQDICVMKRLLDRDGGHLFDGRREVFARLARGRRQCFLQYLRLLIADSRSSFLTSAKDDVEAGRAEVCVLFRRRMSREIAFLELRWFVVKHWLGGGVEPGQIERMAAMALAIPQHRAATSQ